LHRSICRASSPQNYFYPDSPKGYQISAVRQAYRRHGYIDVPDANGNIKRIGITRLHMKRSRQSVHDGFADSANHTYIDLNRCGTPLVECLRTRYRSADEAWGVSHSLKDPSLHRRLGLQYGRGFIALRWNVSVMLRGAPEFGTSRVKNVNSFRFIRDAINYEIETPDRGR